MDIASLMRLKEVIQYCEQYHEKIIFILDCLHEISGQICSEDYIEFNDWAKSIAQREFYLLPLSEANILQELYEQPSFSSLTTNQQNQIVNWINGNEVLLRQVVDALQGLSQQNINLAQYLENNTKEFAKQNLRQIYLAILSNLNVQRRHLLNLASVSGSRFYSKLLSAIDILYLQVLKEIEIETKLIESVKFQKGDYIFRNELIYNLILSSLQQPDIDAYRSQLIQATYQLLREPQSKPVELFLLERLNDFLKNSKNQKEKRENLLRLIQEYERYFMFQDCSASIDAYGDIKGDDTLILHKAKCAYELGEYSECIALLSHMHKPQFFILKMKALYRNGEPQKIIKSCKRKSFIHWTDQEKGEIYSLLAGCYEWLGKKANYVYCFQKAQRLLRKEKNESYYNLMRKLNMVYDYDLPIFSQFFKETLSFFEKINDYRSCAWVLHNWGTECVLKVKDSISGLEKLTRASEYLSDVMSIDRVDVDNSIALYEMIHENWKRASEILIQIHGKSNLLFCNLAYMINEFHCARKLSDDNRCIALLKEIENIIQNSSPKEDIQLQKQNYYVSKGIYLLEKNNETEALKLFIKALTFMREDYYSYYTAVSAHYILLLSHKNIRVDKKILRLAERNAATSNSTVRKMIEQNITLAEIMFWN